MSPLDLGIDGSRYFLAELFDQLTKPNGERSDVRSGSALCGTLRATHICFKTTRRAPWLNTALVHYAWSATRVKNGTSRRYVRLRS